MKAKRVQLWTGNGTCIVIAGKHIEELVVLDIGDNKTAETVVLQISRKADKKFLLGDAKAVTVFERICRYSDIAEIRVEERMSLLKRKSKIFSVFTYWNETDDETNSCQTNVMDEKGSLHIVISKDLMPKNVYELLYGKMKV